MFSQVLHRAADLRQRHRDHDDDRRRRHAVRPADRAVPATSRRRRCWSPRRYPGANAKVLSDTVAVARRAGGQRRRGHALHVLDLLERRLVHADRHLRGRHRPRQGPGAGAEPAGHRPAAGCPQEVQRQGITAKKQSTNIILAVSLISPDKRYDDLYLSNYATLRRQGRAEPDLRRRRRPGASAAATTACGSGSTRRSSRPAT